MSRKNDIAGIILIPKRGEAKGAANGDRRTDVVAITEDGRELETYVGCDYVVFDVKDEGELFVRHDGRVGLRYCLPCMEEGHALRIETFCSNGEKMLRLKEVLNYD